jgi:hypothetical protein
VDRNSEQHWCSGPLGVVSRKLARSGDQLALLADLRGCCKARSNVDDSRTVFVLHSRRLVHEAEGCNEKKLLAYVFLSQSVLYCKLSGSWTRKLRQGLLAGKKGQRERERERLLSLDYLRNPGDGKGVIPSTQRCYRRFFTIYYYLNCHMFPSYDHLKAEIYLRGFFSTDNGSVVFRI